MDPAELFLKLQEKLDEENIKCPVCLSKNLRFPTILYPCFHHFCAICHFQWAQMNDSCPVCRQDLVKIFCNVVSPTDYKTVELSNFFVKKRLWKEQLLGKYYSLIMIAYFKEKGSNLPRIMNFKTFHGLNTVETSVLNKEQLFISFCFNVAYIPKVKAERNFSIINLQKRPGYRDRLIRFLFFYLEYFSFHIMFQQKVEEIMIDLKYATNFDDYFLDFKMKLLDISEIVTSFLPYNFTKRLQYEFFAFAISGKEEYESFMTETDYYKTDKFNQEYEELIRMIKSLNNEDREESTSQINEEAIVPSPIQNGGKVTAKQIHEFRRYIRLALSSNHWFKHLAKYIVNKSIPGKQNVLTHRTFKFLEPFIHRIIRVRGIVDVQGSAHEKELLRLLVHESRK